MVMNREGGAREKKKAPVSTLASLPIPVPPTMTTHPQIWLDFTPSSPHSPSPLFLLFSSTSTSISNLYFFCRTISTYLIPTIRSVCFGITGAYGEMAGNFEIAQQQNGVERDAGPHGKA
jgi:hypothetical protein